MFKNKETAQRIEHKAKEFKLAIEKYQKLSLYMNFEWLIAIIIISLQGFTLVNLIQSYQHPGLFVLIFCFIIAYLATDFFNGLIHMMMDNNTQYTSVVGPFIAAFHLHHSKLKYTEKHPLIIYFNESGHKIWLAFYLVFLCLIQLKLHLNTELNLILTLFGILSSWAELSHFWCHNSSNSKIIIFLQKYYVLLSMKHHRLHHCQDNINYAFLNGLSDPLLNLIARFYYKGYKNNSDKHVDAYVKGLIH
ncbi:MAG: fatty acid desaturase family protein [Proteobacteria bacterium]|nr:fatty acid desaturase family protein [Pseudomonadota bacterium]